MVYTLSCRNVQVLGVAALSTWNSSEIIIFIEAVFPLEKEVELLLLSNRLFSFFQYGLSNLQRCDSKVMPSYGNERHSLGSAVHYNGFKRIVWGTFLRPCLQVYGYFTPPFKLKKQSAKEVMFSPESLPGRSVGWFVCQQDYTKQTTWFPWILGGLWHSEVDSIIFFSF